MAITFFTLCVMFSLGLIMIAILYVGAKQNKQATFVEEGTMKFKIKGNSFEEVLLNVDGYNYNPSTHKIEGPGLVSERTRLQKHGIYWVSWLYPLKRILTFKISKDRLKSSGQITQPTDLSQLVEHESGVLVDNLRWQFTRPFVIREVDFKDGTRVDFLIFAVFQVVDPYLAVFVHGGEKFFNILTSSVQALLVDYCKKLEFKVFTDTVTSDSFFRELLKINDGTTGILEITGIKVISGRIEEYNISAKDQKVQDAVQQKEINRRLAEAEIQKAKGDRTATIIRAAGTARAKERIGKAEGVRLDKELEALRARGVTPDVAAEVIRATRVSENIGGKDTKVTTYLEGDRPKNRPNIVIP